MTPAPEHTAPASSVHLRFLGWEEPILRSAARVLLDREPSGRVLDLSRDLVVLPGSRAGRRLREILVEEAEAAGRALRPPRLATVGSLPEHLYAPEGPAPGAVAQGAAWRLAVERLRPEEIAAVAPPAPGLDPEAARASLAAALRELRGRVGASGLSFAEVASRRGNGLLYDDEERWKVFAHAETEYRAILQAAGWEDRDDARRAALREDHVGFEGRLWLVATPDLPPIARAFVAALRPPAEIEVLVGAPEELAPGFDALGCVLPDAWEEARSEFPDSAIRVVTAPAEQAEVAIDFLRRVARGRSAEEITIGVPDPDVIPFVGERLAEEGIPTRHAEGRPVEATPAYRLLRAAADYLDREDAEAFADLLRHPWVEEALEREAKGGAPARAVQSQMDRYRTLHLPVRLGRKGEPLPSGGERVSDGPASAVHRIRDALLEFLSPLEGVRRISEWPAGIRELLTGAVPAGQDGALEGEAAEVMAKIGGVLEEMEGLAGLPDSAAGMDARVAAPAAIRRIFEELAGDRIPPEPDEEAVELLGWLELALDDAPILVVIGANEPHLPESVTFDPFLPHALQESLGLLGNGGRWARDLLYARTILRTRPHVLFVAGRQDSDGNPLHLSRLLLADEPVVVAKRIQAFLSETSERAPGPEGDEEGETLELPPEPILSAPTPIESLSVTAFRALLTDPYRFALERILLLDGEDDRARELDPLSFGSLAHTVLQRWAEGEARDETDAAKIRARLDAILDEESAGRFGSHPLPAARIQVEQLRRRLHAFAKWQAGWRSDGWRIVGVELSIGGEGAHLVVDGTPMAITGKVDRVDRHEESGEWRILDYKTSEAAKGPEETHRKGRGDAKEWVDLQLPLYRHLAGTLRDVYGNPLIPSAALPTLKVGYLTLANDPARVDALWAEWAPPDWEGAIERAREIVRLVRANRFEVRRDVRVEADDPLAGVLGGGVLLLADDEEGGGSDA